MGTNQYVICTTMADFIAVIKGAVMNGLTFHADASKLTVYFDGGY